jgi:hypothetical protein
LKARYLPIAILTSIAALLAVIFAPSAVADPLPNLEGRWVGQVNWPTGTYPATVDIMETAPLRGTIDISGFCRADWSEVSRTGTSVRVHATVTYATTDCTDGDWELTATTGTLAGPSPDHPGHSIALIRAPAPSTQTCGNQRAAIFEPIPPGVEAALSIVAYRIAALPKWVGSTLLIAACIPEAIDANPGGGVPNLWTNLNSPAFFDAVCRTAESLLDPLGLGYTKNFFCGAPVR